MKITVIQSVPKEFGFGLSEILEITDGIMSELGVEVYTADLFDDPIHHYKGILSDTVSQIAENIKNSDGVIFATTSCLFAPSSALQSLFEYLYHDYSDVLKDKNCMSVVVSLNDGDRSAQDYLGKVLTHFGAFDSIRLCVDDKTAKSAAIEDSEERNILEKQIEDFYRIAAQNRKFFVPKSNEPVVTHEAPPAVRTMETIEMPIPIDDFDDNELKALDSIVEPRNTGANSYKFEELSEDQMDDVEQLTSFFSKILDSPANNQALPDFTEPPAPGISIPPAKKTLKGASCLFATKSLPNKFNASEASGINAVMQLNISGIEGFTGYLHINNSECTFSEGTTDNPDITIMSDSAVWGDILKGKITAQKAFMIGGLKVRGNFTILNKFEKMFDVSM